MGTIDKSSIADASGERYQAKARLDLNDLLEKRKNEKKIDKKTNLLIFSGATAVALVVILILSL